MQLLTATRLTVTVAYRKAVKAISRLRTTLTEDENSYTLKIICCHRIG